MTFENHFHSVSRAASKRLGILRKSSQLFHDRLLLGRFFRGFVLPVLEYRFDLWCLAADTHLKLLDRVVNGAIFLTKSLFDCTSSVCGSILYAVQDKVSDAPSLWCSTCAVCADATSVHLWASSLPNLAVSQDLHSTVSISVERSWWPRIRWCVTGGFQEQGQYLFIGLAARSLFVSYCFPFLFFHSMGWYCGAAFFGLIGC